MLTTKVFTNSFGKKIYFLLSQLNALSAESVVPEQLNEDYQIDNNGDWYISLYEFRSRTKDKHEWLYREMSNVKIMVRIAKSIQLSMHFFERWTDPSRRGDQFNLNEFKQELIDSEFIYKGISPSKEHKNVIYVYFNRISRCVYILNQDRTVVVTMWKVNEIVTDNVSNKSFLYSELVEMLLAARYWFRGRNKNMDEEKFDKIKGSIRTLEYILITQKADGNSNQIYELANDLGKKLSVAPSDQFRELLTEEVKA